VDALKENLLAHPVISALLEHFRKNLAHPVVVVSHPRSGTHLLLDTLRLNFPACRATKKWGEPLHHVYLDFDKLLQLTPQQAIDILSRCPRPLIKSHAMPDMKRAVVGSDGAFDPELIAYLGENATFFYMYRDGRQTLSSFHIMESGAAPDEAPVSLAQFIRQMDHGQSRAKLWANHVAGWMARPGVHAIAMEDLLGRPAAVLPVVAAKLGIQSDTDEWRLPQRPTQTKQRLARLFSRNPASTALLNKKPHDDWHSVLGEEDRRFLLQEFDGLLVKLGYEKSDDWVKPENDKGTK
jgi:hypothetical protein